MHGSVSCVSEQGKQLTAQAHQLCTCYVRSVRGALTGPEPCVKGYKLPITFQLCGQDSAANAKAVLYLSVSFYMYGLTCADMLGQTQCVARELVVFFKTSVFGSSSRT